jgi:hypothetical protein
MPLKRDGNRAGHPQGSYRGFIEFDAALRADTVCMFKLPM